MHSLFPQLTELKKQHYAYYLYAMLAPKELRPQITTLLAFEWELAQIPHKVSEPMLGQIRFAWWRETLEMLESGHCPRAHPVIDGMKLIILFPASGRALGGEQNMLPLLKQRLEMHQQHYDAENSAACSNLEQSLITEITETIKNVNEAAAKKWEIKAQRIQHYAAQDTVSPRALKLLFQLFVT